MSILEYELVEEHVYEGRGADRIVVKIGIDFDGSDLVYYRFCSNNPKLHYTQVFSCKKATFKKWAFEDITDTIDSDDLQQALTQPWHVDAEHALVAEA